MKRLLTFMFASILTTSYTAADDHTMIISLSDGSIYAIHNKNIKSIGFSKYDLNEKYYVLKTDTLMVRDTVVDIKTVYDTVYIDKPYAVHDTVYVDKEVVKHDTIYVERGHDERSFYTLNEKEYPMPKAIDLGLPSGTKWANINIGAKDIYDKGHDFSYNEMNAFMNKFSEEWSLPTFDDYMELFNLILTQNDYSSYNFFLVNEELNCFEYNKRFFLPITETLYDEWTWMDYHFSYYCKYINMFIYDGEIHTFGNEHGHYGEDMFWDRKSSAEKGYIRLIKK